MFKNLKIEWLKIKHYKVFWIFTILYFLGIISIVFIGYKIYENTLKQIAGDQAKNMVDSFLLQPFRFPKLWQTSGWLSSWLLYFPGMIVMLHTINEFNFKTHRQNIIDGWKRETFITQKILLAIIFALVITLINFITSIIFSQIANANFSFEGIKYLGFVFIQSLVYILFAFMLAVVFRRSGAALAIFFLYGLIFEGIISGLFNYLTKTSWGYFLPLQTTDVLLAPPFGKDVFYKDSPSETSLLIVSAIYIFAFCYFAYRKFKYDDL